MTADGRPPTAEKEVISRQSSVIKSPLIPLYERGKPSISSPLF